MLLRFLIAKATEEKSLNSYMLYKKISIVFLQNNYSAICFKKQIKTPIIKSLFDQLLLQKSKDWSRYMGRDMIYHHASRYNACYSVLDIQNNSVKT